MELTSTQKNAISLLATSELAEKFYWTGGTLLAYHYLKHRNSLDLDFFSDKQFSFSDINSFIQSLKKKGEFKTVKYQKVFDRYEFLFSNSQVLRIEFVYFNHEKKLLQKRGRLLGVAIDSLEDIAANKLLAHLDRNEPKDLFDIYFLLTRQGFTVKKLLELAKQKFGIEFQESLFWSEAFKTLPLLSELKPLMLMETNEKEALLKNIEKYFKEESAKFLKKNLE